VASSGRTWINPGAPGAADNYGGVRFVAPASGSYEITSDVETLFVGPTSEDADYHVVRNGTEIFGANLPPSRNGVVSTSGYTNTFSLTSGDTLDFLAGRGPDGQADRSGLKIRLSITLVSGDPVPPAITQQPLSITVVEGETATFTVQANGGQPLSYQWKYGESEITGETANTLVLTNVQMAQTGNYSVTLSNAYGVVASSNATLTVVQYMPIFDLSRDFSLTTNPKGVWSYGSKSNLDGALSLFTYHQVAGVFDNWHTPGQASVITRNSSDMVSITEGGEFVAPPGDVVLVPGAAGAPDNFSVARFTVPSDGEYLVDSAVQTFFVGPHSGDTDYHVVRDGVELFGEFIAASNLGVTNRSGYTNTLTLATGEVLDFLSGRGADGDPERSGIHLSLRITMVSTNLAAPALLNQPVGGTINEHSNFAFTVIASGSSPLSYQWRQDGLDIAGATNSSLVLSDLQLAQAGGYDVVVTNSVGSITSVVANLIVNRVRVLELGQNEAQQEGTTITVPVDLISTGDVGGLTFKVSYDTNYLKNPTLVWDSSLDGAFTDVNTTKAGEVRGTIALPATSIAEGTQTIAQLSFFLRSVSTSLSTPLGLQVSEMSDANGDPLVGTLARGSHVDIQVRTIIGDNNANNRLDVGDATAILRYLSQIEETRPWDITLNDLNGSASLESGDVIKVLRVTAGLDPQPGGGGGAGFAATKSARKSGPVTAIVSPASIQSAPGQNVTVQVRLQNMTAPVAGASFTLNYNTNAMRLLAATSYHGGTMIPTGSPTVWNVAPANGNFTVQNGHVSFAVSSANAWSANNGILAELIFQVQAGGVNQYLWPITITSVETTENGYVNDGLTASGATLSVRGPVAATLSPSASFVNGQFTLTVNGDSGASYIVEASDDLKSWVTVGTVIPTNGSAVLTDAGSGTHTKRFYRVKTD